MPVVTTVETCETGSAGGTNMKHQPLRRTPPGASPGHMLIRMPAPSGHLIRMPAPSGHLELPHPRRLLWTAAGNMAESVGLPFRPYDVLTDTVQPDPGLLA